MTRPVCRIYIFGLLPDPSRKTTKALTYSSTSWDRNIIFRPTGDVVQRHFVRLNFPPKSSNIHAKIFGDLTIG